MTNTERAILKTLAYSDIFSFPLTQEELWQFLLSNQRVSRNDFEQTLKQLTTVSKRIALTDGYYSLKQEKKVRRASQAEVQKKLRIAKRAAYYLSYIPTILLIGLSGSVAMGKVDKKDDIDFFIITKKNTLFMTRLWVQAVLELLTLRRKREDADAPDKICVNLLIDESKIKWLKDRKDIYTAHEILQMKPLFERNNMYEQFLNQNTWVQKYFPNAFDIKQSLPGIGWKRNYMSLQAISTLIMIRPLEALVRFIQKKQMKRYQTKEVITDQVLAFHPVDYRSKTLADLNTKLKLLGLLTNK